MPATCVGLPQGRWTTRANLLSALRLLAAPALALALCGGAAGAAALLFALAVASDLVDGRVARRFGESSALGGLLDHAADASFVTAGLGALARRGELPAALPVLVALAFLQYTLDSGTLRRAPPAAARAGPQPLRASSNPQPPRASSDPQPLRASSNPQPLRASRLGRWNGIAYYVLLGVPVLRDGLGLGWPPPALVRAAALLLVASTLLSMADRARAHWRSRQRT